VNGPGISSSVQSYELQGPAAPTGLCLLNFANAGCTGNLKVNASRSLFTFVENEAFFSHELDFSSTNNGPVQWIAGLYWYHKHYNQPINNIDPTQDQVASPDYLSLTTFLLSPAPLNPSRSVFNQDTILTEDSYAAFGQVDWKITDTIKLTGGVRYSDDRKFGSESHRTVLFDADAVVPGFPLGVNQFGSNTPALDFTSCPATTFPGAGLCHIDPTTGYAVRSLNASWNAWTGTADISWTPDPSTLAYAKYSRGYKTGGFNSGIMADFPETQPETVDAFEVGFKKTVGRMFQANLAGFYYNFYNDQQPFSAFSNGVTVTEIFNIPTVHTWGVELEAIWQPVKDLTFNLSYAYLNSTIASMVQPNGQLLCVLDTNDPLAIAPGANTNGCPAGSGTQNLTGQILPETPRNKISLNGIYRMNFEPGTLALSGTFTWKDQTYDSPFNRPYNLAPSYSQVNLRATWTDIKNRYSVILFCDNVFNTLGYDGVTGLAVTDPGVNQAVDPVYTYTAPRTYGVEVQVRWQ
jgi:iron complex outermembrane receptor protein